MMSPMFTRRLVATLVASSVLVGLVACSSDEPESGPADESDATTTIDLTGVPVDEICASLGVVYTFFQGLAGTGLGYPEVRAYLEAEVPGVVEAMRDAAEQSPEELASTLDDLATRTEESYAAAMAIESERDFVVRFITPDPVSAALYAEVDQFADAECGFRLVAS